MHGDELQLETGVGDDPVKVFGHPCKDVRISWHGAGNGEGDDADLSSFVAFLLNKGSTTVALQRAKKGQLKLAIN